MVSNKPIRLKFPPPRDKAAEVPIVSPSSEQLEGLRVVCGLYRGRGVEELSYWWENGGALI